MEEIAVSDSATNEKFMVRHGTMVRGPLSYKDVEFLVRLKEIPPDAEFRTTEEFEWSPISQLVGREGAIDREVKGLLPNMTDALFYLGVFLFFVGAVIYFAVHPIVGDLVLIGSLVLEVYPVVRSFKKEPKAVTKTIGNIIALMWSAFQGLLTLLLLVLTFS